MSRPTSARRNNINNPAMINTKMVRMTDLLEILQI